MRPDVAISLHEGAPAPLRKYLCDSLIRIGFEVQSSGPDIYLLTLPRTALERHAEKLGGGLVDEGAHRIHLCDF